MKSDMEWVRSCNACEPLPAVSFYLKRWVLEGYWKIISELQSFKNHSCCCREQMGSEGVDRETMWTQRETKCGLISNYVSHEVWLYLSRPFNFCEITLKIFNNNNNRFLNYISKDSKECWKYSILEYFGFLHILA